MNIFIGIDGTGPGSDRAYEARFGTAFSCAHSHVARLATRFGLSVVSLTLGDPRGRASRFSRWPTTRQRMRGPLFSRPCFLRQGPRSGLRNESRKRSEDLTSCWAVPRSPPRHRTRFFESGWRGTVRVGRPPSKLRGCSRTPGSPSRLCSSSMQWSGRSIGSGPRRFQQMSEAASTRAATRVWAPDPVSGIVGPRLSAVSVTSSEPFSVRIVPSRDGSIRENTMVIPNRKVKVTPAADRAATVEVWNWMFDQAASEIRLSLKT